TRRVEMIQPLGRRCVERERGAIDRKSRRGLLKRALGAGDVALLQQRPRVQRERLARGRGIGGDARQRFARLAQKRATLPRTLEPHLTERATDLRLVRAALEGAAER